MGKIGMSQRELLRLEVLARAKSSELEVVDAASLVGVSYRQAKRLWKRYREEGARGLKHGNAERASARAKPARFRRRVMKPVREKYEEGEGEQFGPTLAAEHLASEDGMRIDAEPLRLWMMLEELWSRRRKRKPYPQRRERRRHLGELVQMDGSFHDWSKERGPDDTHQDQLIKKMRRKKIPPHEQANIYPQQEYLPEHNKRFRRAAAEGEDYHRRAPRATQWREAFRLESERIVSNVWVVRYDNRLFQVQVQSRNYAPAQGKVVVCQWQDGMIEIEYRGRKLPWKKISIAPPRPSGESTVPRFRVAACAAP